MVLKSVLLNLIAQRVQEIVVVVVMRAVELVGLPYQVAVCLDMLGLQRQQLGPVGKQVHVHGDCGARIEIELGGVAARVQRTVDERFQRGALEARLRMVGRGGFKGRAKLPIDGQLQLHLSRDLPREIAGGVKHQFVPFDQHQLTAHFQRADFAAGGREIIEVDVDRVRARLQIQAQREDIDRIALPGNRRSVGGDSDTAEPIDRAFRRVGAGQPLGIQQHGIGADAAQGFMNMHDAMARVAGIDLQMNLAGVGAILWRDDGRDGCGRAGARGGLGGGLDGGEACT